MRGFKGLCPGAGNEFELAFGVGSAGWLSAQSGHLGVARLNVRGGAGFRDKGLGWGQGL